MLPAFFSAVYFLKGFSEGRKPGMHFIAGPTINLSYGQFISSGIGFHLDNIIMTRGNRAGHWKLHNFQVLFFFNSIVYDVFFSLIRLEIIISAPL